MMSQEKIRRPTHHDYEMDPTLSNFYPPMRIQFLPTDGRSPETAICTDDPDWLAVRAYIEEAKKRNKERLREQWQEKHCPKLWLALMDMVFVRKRCRFFAGVRIAKGIIALEKGGLIEIGPDDDGNRVFTVYAPGGGVQTVITPPKPGATENKPIRLDSSEDDDDDCGHRSKKLCLRYN